NKPCLASPKEPMIENNINLMSLSGVTPRRYLLNVAKVLLTPEQLGNGFLPDFRGKRDGRVPITQEDVDKLTEAVRRKFSFKTEDMQSLWRDVLRGALIQKTLDAKNKQKVHTCAAPRNE
ncbi:unnamed protein product, partial [Didymodactylos carnosus]